MANLERPEILRPVSDRETYVMTTFMKMVGWQRHAMKQARLKGLKVVRVGGRCFVRGCDFSAWLGQIGDDPTQASDTSRVSSAG